MEVLRLKIKQNQANYRKEETVENKMTYPLPPLSTISGALHNICKFTEYKEINISVQGKYGALQKKIYTNHAYLNSVQDDRGILVKPVNTTIQSKAFIPVAKALSSTGNSFKNGITIEVYNQELLEEYIQSNKDFATLTTSVKFYEILTDIELILHIQSDDLTIKLIKENIYSLQSLGRSEDFIHIEEVKTVKLNENIDKEYISKYSAYIDYNLIKNKSVSPFNTRTGNSANGTRYKLNKKYNIVKNKRIFEKKDVVFVSNYLIDEESKGVFIDEDGYIVNLL